MKLYVGTYGKYASGSIDGAWLDLDKFKNGDEFLKACKKLHSDEREPEFMFQDVEVDAGADWQEGLYSESSIPWDYWTLKAQAEREAEEARKNETTSAKAEREAQRRFAERWLDAAYGHSYTRVNGELTEAACKRREKDIKDMIGAHHFVELDGGYIVTIDVPSIETRFCCGEDDHGQGGCGYGTMAFAHKYLDNLRTENGFKRKNIRSYDKTMRQKFGRKACANAHEWNARGAFETSGFVPCIATSNKGIDEHMAHIINAAEIRSYSFRLVRVLTDADMARLRNAVMFVRSNFVKRLNAYWKRFGNTKIHTWTYWTEA